MYFNRFYEFRERAKNLLNAVNKVADSQKVDVGKFLKAFDSAFDAEIRARHSVHHRERFDDIQINKIGLIQLMTLGEGNAHGWESEHRVAYRTATREWVKRVKSRAASLQLTIENIATAIIACCPFLVAEFVQAA
jgi:hypothetical protein